MRSEIMIKGLLLRQEVLMEALKTNREAMLVENRARESLGQSAAYSGKDFTDLHAQFNRISEIIGKILEL